MRRRLHCHLADLGEVMKDRKPGTVAANKIPIYDHRGRPRGHVGAKATALTVARFTGTLGATLGRKNGRRAWLGAKPLADVSAAGTTAGAPAPETANHKSARGSVPAKGERS
jgi:hypothetical protein